MALRPEHELHQRRKSRNAGLGLVLALFVALVFGLTVVKIGNGWKAEGFDHQPRNSLLPAESLPAPDAAPATSGGQP